MPYKDRDQAAAASRRSYARLTPEQKEAAAERKRRRAAANPELAKILQAAYDKKTYLKNPEKFAKRRRQKTLSRYGLTQEAYDEMLVAQGGVCKLCLEECVSGRNLAIDHCHETGLVRGLLCCRCNRGIGSLKDDPMILHRAIEYLLDAAEKKGEIPERTEEMRSQKTGSELELLILASFSRTLRRLAPDMRNRIVNWLSAQDWSDEKPAAVQPADSALS